MFAYVKTSLLLCNIFSHISKHYVISHEFVPKNMVYNPINKIYTTNNFSHIQLIISQIQLWVPRG